jgi:ethanolamine-phosphate phospho-lyase
MTKETGESYANEVKGIVESNCGIGVFIAESVVGCGGQIVLPPKYLELCYDVVRSHGGVCIADEVQTGFARSGTHFWYFQTYNVVPDIVSVGKPMGNGYPVAAVICRREIADSFASSGIEYFNTYGGNSVSMSISEAVYDAIMENNLMRQAKETGEYLIGQLSALQKEFDWIGDVRGQGLFLGLEFVYSVSRNDLTPFAELCKFVVDYLRFDRVLISRDGPDHNVIKIKPPLVFGKKEADLLLNSLRSALVDASHCRAFEYDKWKVRR